MGIFSRTDDHNDKNGCPVENGESTMYEHGTAHTSLYAVSGFCAAVTLLSAIALIAPHLRRYCVPREQRQIVRIIFTPFAFAIIALASISNYHAAPYIDPLGEYYSSFCLPALFLLYIQFVAPDSEFGDDMFQAMHTAAERSFKRDKGDWPRLSWLLVFQYPVTETLAIVVLEGTEAAGTYCSTSLKPKFGHLWFSIIKTIGLVLCFITIVRFYARTKSVIKARRGMSKLVCFKGIVFLRFVQTWIFNILVDKGVMKPSKQFSYGDLMYGIPNTVLAAEMVIFSLGFWYAFSSSEYSSKAKPHKQRMTVFRALFDALNPSDILLGILRAVTVLGGRRQYPAAGPVASYGNIRSKSYRHGAHSSEGDVEGHAFEEYSQSVFQPLPPTYRNREEEELAQRDLVTGASSGRTPSPRRY